MKNAVLAILCVAVAALLVMAFRGNTGSDAGAGPKSHLYRVIESGKIRVAIIPDNPGWSVLGKDGNYTGYDVDVANKLAEALGVKVEWVSCSGPQRLPLAQTDKVDAVITCFTATSERAKSVAFSFPYGAGGILGLCKQGNVFADWDELANKRISVPRGTMADLFVTGRFPNAEIVRFDSIADAFMALKTDKVDVLMEEDPAVYDLAKSNPDMEPMPVAPARSSYVAMAVQHGDPIWLGYLNQFIQDKLFSGELNEMYNVHFGRDLPKLVTY